MYVVSVNIAIVDPTISGRRAPRASFELYIVHAAKESRPWNAVDREIVNFFLDRLTNYVHNEMLSTFKLSLEHSNADSLKAVESV